MSTLLGLGRAAGADLVEFFLERNHYLGALVEDDRLTSVSPRLSLGAGIRVFRGTSDCYVSTNDLSFQGLRSALEKALGLMGLLLPSAQAYVPEIHLELLRDYGQGEKERWRQNCSSIAEVAEVLLAGSDRLQQTTSHLQSRRLSYFRDWQEVLVAASDGTFARDIRLTQSAVASVLCADGEHRAVFVNQACANRNFSARARFNRRFNRPPHPEFVAGAAGRRHLHCYKFLPPRQPEAAADCLE